MPVNAGWRDAKFRCLRRTKGMGKKNKEPYAPGVSRERGEKLATAIFQEQPGKDEAADSGRAFAYKHHGTGKTE